MSDFLTRLAQRTLGVAPTVQPVLAPLFAPQPVVTTEWAASDLPAPGLEQTGEVFNSTDNSDSTHSTKDTSISQAQDRTTRLRSTFPSPQKQENFSPMSQPLLQRMPDTLPISPQSVPPQQIETSHSFVAPQHQSTSSPLSQTERAHSLPHISASLQTGIESSQDLDDTTETQAKQNYYYLRNTIWKTPSTLRSVPTIQTKTVPSHPTPSATQKSDDVSIFPDISAPPISQIQTESPYPYVNHTANEYRTSCL